MRVLMTTDTVGGVWTFTNELSQELVGRGHHVHLVGFGREASEAQREWARQLERASGTFSFVSSAIPLEWMQENERSGPEGRAWLLSEAEQFRPDLLVSNQFCFGSLEVRFPRLVVAHSDVLSWAAACKPSALEPTPWLNRYTSLVQSGLLSASAVVAPTQWMYRALVRSFFLANGATVIPNGRSVEAPGGVDKKLQAISLGRLWDEAKGLETLADLDFPMPVVVGGEGAFDGAEAPANLAAVRWLGSLSEQEAVNALTETAVYVCTSLYEPFGLAPLEAGLCGCALVLRDLPSLQEVWGDAAVYFSDSAGLQRILQKLKDSPEILSELQRRAVVKASQYTVRRMTDGYLQLFEAVLGQSVAVPHVP